MWALHESRRRTVVPRLARRSRVALTRAKLDRQLATGSPPAAAAADLALRADQLTDPLNRQRLARRLRGVVERVDRVGSRPFISAVVIDRAAVSAGRDAILGLAGLLESTTTVRPAGVVLAGRLLTDGLTSPLFNRECGRTVADAVWEVADALVGGAETPAFLVPGAAVAAGY